MTLNAFILDDELSVRETLKTLIQEFCPNVTVVGMSANIAGAAQCLSTEAVDILFLDIDLGNKSSGFDLLEILKQQHDLSVVVVSASEQHALRSYDYEEVSHYLMKPVNHLKLISTIASIVRKKQLGLPRKMHNNLQAVESHIALSDMNQILLVQPKEIIYIAGNGSYSTFYFKNGTTNQQSRHLKHFEDILMNNPNFIRVHKSYLVNKNYIKAYLKDGVKILLSNNVELPTSLSNKEFVKLLSV